jgi:hypothetical protein
MGENALDDPGTTRGESTTCPFNQAPLFTDVGAEGDSDVDTPDPRGTSPGADPLDPGVEPLGDKSPTLTPVPTTLVPAPCVAADTFQYPRLMLSALRMA